MSEAAKTQFPLGRVVATAAATRTGVDLISLVDRHARGDWGDVSPADRSRNEDALTNGGRLFSSYRVEHDKIVYVITEADRSATTVLLPSDY